MKKLISVSVAVLLMLSLCACSAAIPEEPPTAKVVSDASFRYTVYEDHTEITAWIGDAADAVIPTEKDGKSVTVIATAAFRDSEIRTVSFPDSVREIGFEAFSGCTELESLSLPAGLVSIADSAFSECTSLTEVTLPASLTSLGEYAFTRCLSLESVVFSASLSLIPAHCFESCSVLASVTVPDPEQVTVGEDAFLDCPCEGIR